MLFAFAAAFANALNVVTQHVASTAAPAKDKGWRLALYLIRNPLWLFGVIAMVASFVLQAIALYNGAISVVQSILVTELVFSLVLARVWLRREVVPAAWASASVTSAGLAVFLVMSEPRGGHPQATARAWLPALLVFGGLTAILAVLARGRLAHPSGGALCHRVGDRLGAARHVHEVGNRCAGGPRGTGLVQQGAFYGVIAAGIVGTVLTQAALHYGPLAVSQPLMVIVDPLVSVILGVWLYGEHFEGGGLAITMGALGFVAMITGVVLLARTAPSFAATPAASPSPA